MLHLELAIAIVPVGTRSVVPLNGVGGSDTIPEAFAGPFPFPSPAPGASTGTVQLAPHTEEGNATCSSPAQARNLASVAEGVAKGPGNSVVAEVDEPQAVASREEKQVQPEDRLQVQNAWGAAGGEGGVHVPVGLDGHTDGPDGLERQIAEGKPSVENMAWTGIEIGIGIESRSFVLVLCVESDFVIGTDSIGCPHLKRYRYTVSFCAVSGSGFGIWRLYFSFSCVGRMRETIHNRFRRRARRRYHYL
ncbi:hypothetical protein EYZ11_008262 [Aspergillus tanneri]|uniref:Uncharacterized protein n=1 Tax=Aspergillus tanneri TaxID=1220188 RepID=A0A4S3JB52_9EURO|nr:hypothetical protein EYZ11_008262 [Aspergillus tanneri]